MDESEDAEAVAPQMVGLYRGRVFWESMTAVDAGAIQLVRADDTLALLADLGVAEADLFGYSLGTGVALNIITKHPAVVRKAVLATVTYDKAGLHPDMFE